MKFQVSIKSDNLIFINILLIIRQNVKEINMSSTLVNHSHESMTAGCPFHRRAAEPPSQQQSAVEVDADGLWHVRGFSEARQILRSDVTHQSGFLADFAKSNNVLKRQPVLFMEGEEHQSMRQETGKFFTPAAVDKNYREMINTLSDSLVAKLQKSGRANLSDLAMELSVAVASRILGLTDSVVPGLAKRLEGILNNAGSLTASGLSLIGGQVKMQTNLLAFFWLDVKPSLRKRRENPQSDVFSYLLSLGYTDFDVLTEAILYGVAGMATTREFISASLWHIIDRPELRDIMMNGTENERYALLGEILRVEPVVGDLYRRTVADITLETEGRTVTIPKGARIQINIVGSNADESVVGENPHDVCPARQMAEIRPRVPEYVFGFGDGDHRCPGAFVALRETDIFLRKLLALPTLRLEREPKRIFNDVIRSYELRKMIISV